MIAYTCVIFMSGFFGGLAAALLLAACRVSAECGMRSAEYPDIHTVCARDARAFSNAERGARNAEQLTTNHEPLTNL